MLKVFRFLIDIGSTIADTETPISETSETIPHILKGVDTGRNTAQLQALSIRGHQRYLWPDPLCTIQRSGGRTSHLPRTPRRRR